MRLLLDYLETANSRALADAKTSIIALPGVYSVTLEEIKFSEKTKELVEFKDKNHNAKTSLQIATLVALKEVLTGKRNGNGTVGTGLYTDSRYYGPFMDAYPIRVDHQLAKDSYDNLVKQNSPACFDGDYVCISTGILADKLLEKNKHIVYQGFYDVVDYITKQLMTLIPHEYTHIMSQHVWQRKEYYKHEPQYFAEMTMACEIEANRAYLIEKDSMIYHNGITDSLFPDLKKVRTLPEIYDYFKERADKKDNGNFNALKDLMNKSDDEIDKSTAPQHLKQAAKTLKQAKLDKLPNFSKLDGNENKEVLKEAYDELEIDSKELEKEKENSQSEDSSKDLPYEKLRKLSHNLSVSNVAVKAYEIANIRRILRTVKATLKGEVKKGRVQTYSRQSRKYQHSDLIKKGYKLKRIERPKVLVALDESGSMNADVVQRCARLIRELSIVLGGNVNKDCELVIYNNEIEETVKLKDADKVINSYSPCGGTDFTLLVKKALQDNCQSIVNITDGQAYYADFRDKERLKYIKKDGTVIDEIKHLKIVELLVSYGSLPASRDLSDEVPTDERAGIKRIQLDVFE